MTDTARDRPAVEVTDVTKVFNPGRPDEVTALTGIALTEGGA